MGQQHFKRCPGCGIWFTEDDIMTSPSVKPIGMAFMGVSINQIFYFFQHTDLTCGSSFLIEISKFTHLIEESIPEKSLYATKLCEGHCVDLHDLSECQTNCHNAPYRRYLLKMVKAKKHTFLYQL